MILALAKAEENTRIAACLKKAIYIRNSRKYLSLNQDHTAMLEIFKFEPGSYGDVGNFYAIACLPKGNQKR